MPSPRRSSWPCPRAVQCGPLRHTELFVLCMLCIAHAQRYLHEREGGMGEQLNLRPSNYLLVEDKEKSVWRSLADPRRVDPNSPFHFQLQIKQFPIYTGRQFGFRHRKLLIFLLEKYNTYPLLTKCNNWAGSTLFLMFNQPGGFGREVC